jgi:hypothetical protein
MVRTALSTVTLAAALCASGCNSDPFFTQPTDTSTPATEVTDTFDGRLTINGAVTHSFAVQRAGTVTARLTATEPTEVIIGVSLGTWNPTTNVCQLIVTNDSAPGGAAVIGTASTVGNFCVRVYDVGRLSQAILYTVNVTHF